MILRGKTSEVEQNWGVYNRIELAGVLAELAQPIGGQVNNIVSEPQKIEFTSQPISVGDDGLTDSQRAFRDAHMPGFEAPIASANHSMFWRDSSGLVCTSFYNSSDKGGFGPIVPIAAREASVSLGSVLQSAAFLERVDGLTDHDISVLEGTTTDVEPGEIFRVALEASQRQLAIFAISRCNPEWEIDNPQDFIDVIQRSNIMTAAARNYPWELQSSSTWRAMSPGVLERTPEGLVRFDAPTILSLTGLKKHIISRSIETMKRAVEEKGLTPQEAVDKYHRDLDEVPETYMRLWQPGESGGRKITVCPATMKPGDRADMSAFSQLVPLHLDLTRAFIGTIDIKEKEAMDGTVITELLNNGQLATTLHVPGISCQHCKHNIQNLILPTIGLENIDVDVEAKTVRFPHDNSEAVRRAIAVLEDNNYRVAL